MNTEAGPEQQVNHRLVVPFAALLVAVQLGVRSWLIVRRHYHADDLRLLRLADESSLSSPSYLLHDFDGQFMPGGFLLAGLAERAAPLEWWPAAVTLIVLQALASLALLRVLRVLLGNRPVLLVPLVFGLFTPLVLGSTTWWAAALNSMPLQIGLAWYLADAVRLAQTGRGRHAVSGVAALAFALAFYLKAVLIPGIAFVVVGVVLLRDGARSPVATAWRGPRWLWLGSAAVLGSWVIAYLISREASPVSHGDVGDVVATVATGFRALAPAVLGGPFSWSGTPPATPFASLPTWSVVTGGVLLLAACGWTLVRIRGALAVWGLVVGTAAVSLVMAGLGRSGLGLGHILPLAYRYFPVEAVLLPVAGALLASLPVRRSGAGLRGTVDRPPVRRQWVAPLTVVLTAVFAVNAVQSTIDHSRAWQSDRTGDYLDTARSSLAAAGQAPLLDQAVPEDVMWGLSAPDNRISRMFAPLPDRPPIEAWTSDLRMLDDDGGVQPAHVVPGVHVADGPVPDCGWAIPPGDRTEVALTDPLHAWEWTVELTYVSDGDGTILIAMDSTDVVQVQVTDGADTVFVRLTGGGQTLRVTAQTAGLGLCIGGGVVGDIALR